MCRFLLEDFHVYAVDIIGHPGKSDEVCLSHTGYDYGKWASEVIDKLGYDKMPCFGGSFGGGILAKLICVAPEKVEKAGYNAPTLVIASEKDCLFPAKKVLSRAKRIFINCKTYELKGSGHMHVLPQSIKSVIVDFLKK